MKFTKREQFILPFTNITAEMVEWEGNLKVLTVLKTEEDMLSIVYADDYVIGIFSWWYIHDRYDYEIFEEISCDDMKNYFPEVDNPYAEFIKEFVEMEP